MLKRLAPKLTLAVMLILILALALPGIVSAFSLTNVATTTRVPEYSWGKLGATKGLTWANGNWWAFYLHNATGFTYASSSDNGSTWNAGVAIGEAVTSLGYMDFCFNSENVSYVNCDTAAGGAIYYRKGRLNEDGVITWYAAEQTIVAGSPGLSPYRAAIFEDTSGMPHVAWARSTSTYLSTSTTNDGTWTEAGVSTIAVTQAEHLRGLWAVPFSDGTYYVAISTVTDSAAGTKGYKWNGTAWGAVESPVTTTTIDIGQNYQTFVLVINSDDIVFVGWAYDTTGKCYVRQRSAVGVWGSAVEIDDYGGGTYPRVELLPLENGEVLAYTAAVNAQTAIDLHIYSGGAWQSDASFTSYLPTAGGTIRTMTSVQNYDAEGEIHYGLLYGWNPSAYTIGFWRCENPTCVTQSAFGVGVTRATMRATRGSLYSVASAGLEDTPQYRFQYGTDTSYASGNTTWTDWDGSYYSLQVTSLTPGTTYHYRAQIRTSFGTGYGADAEFTTYASAGSPTDMIVTPISATELGVSWVMGAGATQSIVRYQTGSFPTTYTDGTSAYSGAASSCTIEDLTPGTTYYVRAWGFDTPTYYSTDYAEEVGTTLAGVEGIDIPDAPSWDATMPETSEVDEAPFYDILDWAATYTHFTTNTLILFVFMVVAIMITITAAILSRGSVLITSAVSVGVMAIGTTQHIVPFWMVVIAFALSLIISYNRSHMAA